MLKINDRFVEISWRKLIYIYFINILKYISSGVISVYGSFNDINITTDISRFFNFLGTGIYLLGQNNNVSDFRSYYINDKISNIFDNVRNILFIGTNIRLELPLLNARLRKHINKKKMKHLYIPCF